MKAVPDGDMRIRIDDTGRWIETGNHDDSVMNRFDEYALEEAVRIKEHFAGTTVEVLSVGPERCRAVIRRALAKGADAGIHIQDRAPGYPAAEAVAAVIAKFCQTRAYDLILAGVISEDLMQGLTGPLVAARLKIPCATAVIRQRIDPDRGTVLAGCELENGWTEEVRLTLPALLTIQSGINRPRYPSLSNMMRSRHQELATLPCDHTTGIENESRVTALSEPALSSSTNFFEGTLEEKAEAFLDLLIEKGVLIT
ncbi:MAG: electron transfer flavoprotein subunit beta/FixA family protein [Desulfobacterales bacterium]|nr:electron transfer flavoprotein subunit beta/FixA family protein [Desulfobacterales bacterium]